MPSASAIRCISLVAGVMLCAGMAFGQGYPSRPVRLITGSTGGASDFVARLLAQRLSESRDALATHGAEPVPTTPEAFAAFLDREIGKWGKVIREAGLKAD